MAKNKKKHLLLRISLRPLQIFGPLNVWKTDKKEETVAPMNEIYHNSFDFHVIFFLFLSGFQVSD